MVARPLVAVIALAAALSSACASGSSDDSGGFGPAGGSSASPSSAPSSASSPSSATSSPSAPSGAIARYVALGDSYTAAPGVGAQSSDGCLRSSSNYPHLLASALGVGRLVDVSCSAADTTDVETAQLDGGKPQLDAVTSDTDLVTIGLGGNDLGLFGRLIGGCLRQDAASVKGTPCTDTLGSVAPGALATIRSNLVAVVAAVREKAPSAQVLLVGYPQIIPASGTCANVPFAPGDYAFARKVNKGLTDAVAAAATTAKATYVDVWSASAGHDICAEDPWINGISGAGAIPFHPFAVEQQAVARLVEATLA